MYVEFHGAAGEVTGSCHRLHVGDRDIALDCGLFQGHRAEANRLNREVPDWALHAHAIVLSHAHLDHSGNLPTLVRRGFGESIFCTPATRDLCSVMLRDAALLQDQDARYINRRNQRDGVEDRVAPLYDLEDASRALGQMISLPLHRPFEIAPGVRLTFHDAGHVLGSALVVLDLEEGSKKLRLLFTGDLGRAELPLLDSPEIVKGVDVLLMESTYGDRKHPDVATLDAELGAIVSATLQRGGRVYIPTFALERAQEVLYALARLHAAGKVPEVPIYIDSPLAIAITEIYKLHPEGLSPDVRESLLERGGPFSPPGLHYVSDVGASRRLQGESHPCIVIAGSGMCEGGRIVHHLATGLPREKNAVVIVGFMAQDTLGRRLLEGRSRVKVLGVERDVRARVHYVAGLSAHADQADLLSFARQTAEQGKLRQVVLVHGEPAAQRALEERLQASGLAVERAVRGRRLEL
ncbi:MAG TPA: MBL fold metallo-hydrolase [Polyangiaceae bacterium]|nr:MBL fold metallo-hydrolase [Polyangiaceae bacterium]